MNTENYRDNFQQSVQKTIDWNLNQDLLFTDLHPSRIDRDHVFAIAENLKPLLYSSGFVDSRSLAGNCVQVNCWLAALLADFGMKSVLTIGSIYLETGHVYMPLTYEKLKNELDAPQPEKALDVHVWLTLEDGSIVDWVGPAWYDQFIGSNYPMHECMDVLTQGVFGDSPYRYKPYLIGGQYLKRVGAIRPE